MADLPLQCIGSHLCNISLGGLVTKQDVYFLPSAKSSFLSLGACEELGLIPEGFLRHHRLAVQALAANTVAESSHHPHRKPSRMLFPPHEEHAHQLEELLLQHFLASTFNTTRNPLPVMEEKPHQIHLLPNAVPYAYHTPTSVPKHWEGKVKPQLKEDITASTSLCWQGSPQSGAPAWLWWLRSPASRGAL